MSSSMFESTFISYGKSKDSDIHVIKDVVNKLLMDVASQDAQIKEEIPPIAPNFEVITIDDIRDSSYDVMEVPAESVVVLMPFVDSGVMIQDSEEDVQEMPARFWCNFGEDVPTAPETAIEVITIEDSQEDVVEVRVEFRTDSEDVDLAAQKIGKMTSKPSENASEASEVNISFSSDSDSDGPLRTRLQISSSDFLPPKRRLVVFESSDKASDSQRHQESSTSSFSESESDALPPRRRQVAFEPSGFDSDSSAPQRQNSTSSLRRRRVLSESSDDEDIVSIRSKKKTVQKRSRKFSSDSESDSDVRPKQSKRRILNTDEEKPDDNSSQNTSQYPKLVKSSSSSDTDSDALATQRCQNPSESLDSDSHHPASPRRQVLSDYYDSSDFESKSEAPAPRRLQVGSQSSSTESETPRPHQDSSSESHSSQHRRVPSDSSDDDSHSAPSAPQRRRSSSESSDSDSEAPGTQHSGPIHRRVLSETSDDDDIVNIRNKKKAVQKRSRKFSSDSDSDFDVRPKQSKRRGMDIDEEESDDSSSQAAPVSEIAVENSSSSAASATPKTPSLLNALRQISTSSESENSEIYDVPSPPSMKRRKADIYGQCIKISRILNREVSPNHFQRLQENSLARSRIQRNLERRHLVCEGGGIERLPLYAYIMCPKSKETFLEGHRIKKMPTEENLHLLVFKTSQINDEDVAECIKKCANGEMLAKDLQMCLRKILDGKDWRSKERFVKGLLKVDKLEDVQDGGLLVCYEKMPDFSKVQEKMLNVLVVKPSDETKMEVIPIFKNNINGSMTEKAYGGNEGILQYLCFGPGIVKTEKMPGTTTSISNVFYLAGDFPKKQILHAVEGFF